LIPYILPIFPALALLSARTLATLDARKVARYMWQASTVWLCVAAVGMTLYTNDGLKERVGTASLGLMWAFFPAGITIAAAAALATRRPLSQAVCVTALSTIVLTSVALLGAQQLPGMGAAGTIARKVQSHLDARTALYCVDDYLQSLPFYLNRACKMVGYRGEMDFGLQQEPARWIPDLAQFAVRWRAESDAAAIVRRDSYDKLSAMELPMNVIFKSAELVVIARK
jgi:hypothetical protein